MEKLGFNLGMAVASRRKAVPISILMREFEGLGHADGAATICPDPGNGPALSRTQESFARGRQIDPALGILAYLPIEIRYIIWEFLLMPQPGDWNEDRRKYAMRALPRVRVKVDESYLRCGECREESEMIMAEIEHDSFAVSSSPSDGARDN
ncbi:MAG: hypothetical protein LQ350_008195 [Teloschistes chrysophthalmus]|nr:MAG: hypothetical protein LQ350_008195 [Niorma chrysophthalma]